MVDEKASSSGHSYAYNIFILVLTVLSLTIMVVLLLPLSEQTILVLQVYDNVICVIFLVDFFLNLRAAPKKLDYFFKQGGWLDLLGSFPSLSTLKYSGLLRLARLNRFAGITRMLRGTGKQELVDDGVKNRSQYTMFTTILMAILVLTVTSVLVLQFESVSPDANIREGGDALWYSLVTLTTVGYGDRYPVTFGGRLTALFIMFMGVGIIGALASILSSMLLGSPSSSVQEEAPSMVPASMVEQELMIIKSELAAMRQLLEEMSDE